MSAKATFGNLKNTLNQKEYITNKKNKLLCCQNTGIYTNYELRNAINFNYLRKLSINKSDLLVTQYTKSDLKDVCVISLGHPPSIHCDYNNSCNPCLTTDQVPINASSEEPFYYNQTIDPLGELFGLTPCGELNYVKYMVPMI